MRTYGQYCGLAKALDHVGDRWTLLIVRELLVGPARFTDLLDGLPGIATNLLTERLRALEHDGLVRRVQLGRPVRATAYELTPAGRELEEAVAALVRWGGRWMVAGPAPGDTQQPRWLLVALRSLLPEHVAEGLRGGVQVHADGVVLAVSAAGGRRSVELGEPGGADAVVEADFQTLLGVAAGGLTLAAARAGKRARVTGDRSVAAALLEPAAPA